MLTPDTQHRFGVKQFSTRNLPSNFKRDIPKKEIPTNRRTAVFFKIHIDLLMNDTNKVSFNESSQLLFFEILTVRGAMADASKQLWFLNGFTRPKKLKG